jgi:hypothetical protein
MEPRIIESNERFKGMDDPESELDITQASGLIIQGGTR